MARELPTDHLSINCAACKVPIIGHTDPEADRTLWCPSCGKRLDRDAVARQVDEDAREILLGDARLREEPSAEEAILPQGPETSR